LLPISAFPVYSAKPRLLRVFIKTWYQQLGYLNKEILKRLLSQAKKDTANNNKAGKEIQIEKDSTKDNYSQLYKIYQISNLKKQISCQLILQVLYLFEKVYLDLILFTRIYNSKK
jgi:hypothetical protein